MSTDQQEGAETTTSEVQVCPGNGNGNETPEQPKGTDAGAEGTEGTGGEGGDEVSKAVDESPIKLTAEQVEELKKEAQEAFSELDADKSGYILATEIEDLFRRFNYEGSYITFSEDYIKEIGAEFLQIGDANGDGKVSFDEYFNAVLKQSGYEA